MVVDSFLKVQIGKNKSELLGNKLIKPFLQYSLVIGIAFLSRYFFEEKSFTFLCHSKESEIEKCYTRISIYVRKYLYYYCVVSLGANLLQ